MNRAPASTAMIRDRRKPFQVGCSISEPAIPKDRRIVLCHETEKSRLTLTCATDHAIETSCPHAYKVVHTGHFGQVAFTIEARPACPIQLTKYVAYHTSHTASAGDLCGRAASSLARVRNRGPQH